MTKRLATRTVREGGVERTVRELVDDGPATAPGSPVPPCVLRGPLVRPDAAGREWVRCDHPAMPLGAAVCSCRGCGIGCGGYEPDAEPSRFLRDVVDPLQIGPYRLSASTWAADPLTVARHKAAMLDLAGRSWTYPGGSGRGVVTCGGGAYWPMAATMMRLLRRRGYTGPIECWYCGSCEPIDAARVDGLGVTLVDMDAVAELHGDMRLPDKADRTLGWARKWYALTHTRFDSVVWLDADAIPLRDVAPLFDLGERHGLAYWSWTKNTVQWPLMGWPTPPGDVPPCFQSGQFAIGRRTAWPLMALTHWMCQHADFYFGDSGRYAVLGDQEAAMVAMALLGVRPFDLGLCEWAPHGSRYALDGEPFIEHPFLSKLFAHSPAYVEAMGVLAEVMAPEVPRGAD